MIVPYILIAEGFVILFFTTIVANMKVNDSVLSNKAIQGNRLEFLEKSIQAHYNLLYLAVFGAVLVVLGSTWVFIDALYRLME